MRTVTAEPCDQPSGSKWRHYICSCEQCALLGRRQDRRRKQRTGGHRPRAELVDTAAARRVAWSWLARDHQRATIAARAGISRDALARVMREPTAPAPTVAAVAALGVLAPFER